MDTIEKKNQAIGDVFSRDYYDLVPEEKNTNSVIVETEWNQQGDNFKKFSLYDTKYTPVSISSSTSFICDL